jgi:hypothetical protein
VKAEAPCGHRARNKGRRSRSVVTAVGKVALARIYQACGVCNNAGFPADAVLGLDGFVTRRASRMICHVGVSDSFDRGERTLRELMGWSIDAETVRRLCHAEAAKCRENQAERREVAKKFEKAAGAQEIQIDAGKVNTETGWRDVKVVSFAVRPPGPPSTSEDYEQRDLPKPSVRRVSAAIETAEKFGQRCLAEAERLKLTDGTNLTVLGDGAEWIWNIAAERFPKAAQNLDVYHATEYLTDLARAGFGDDAPAVKAWSKSAQKRLVADGWAGVCEFVNASAETVKDRAAFEAAYPKAANYLTGHRDRMNYAARLRQGKSIGSGMIEGTIKQMLGRRLKQTGACWKTNHVAPFVELVALDGGPEWESYWAAA